MELRGHTDNVRTLALSQDGTLVRGGVGMSDEEGVGVSGDGKWMCLVRGGMGVSGV